MITEAMNVEVKVMLRGKVEIFGAKMNNVNDLVDTFEGQIGTVISVQNGNKKLYAISDFSLIGYQL